MTREIKFRAWDEVEKDISISFTLDVRGLVEFGKTRGLVFEDIRYRPGRYILMQYTGLRDRNGKEICEGYILRCYTKNLQEVAVSAHKVELPTFYREIWSCKIVDGMWLPADEGETCDGVEIIGNVWENPELLTTK